MSVSYGTRENPIILSDVEIDDDEGDMTEDDDVIEVENCAICYEMYKYGGLIRCNYCVGSCCISCLRKTSSCPFCRSRN